MSLLEKLDARKRKFEASAPKDILEIMHRATEALFGSGIMDRVAKQGDSAPDFTLKSGFGKSIDLKESLKKGPVVLGFYRGSW